MNDANCVQVAFLQLPERYQCPDSYRSLQRVEREKDEYYRDTVIVPLAVHAKSCGGAMQRRDLGRGWQLLRCPECGTDVQVPERRTA